jgi:hypothetical protein
MRGHEHVAGVWIRGDEPGQRIPLDVAGEEQPAARRVHREHEARLVVLHRSRRFIRRMEHADAAERVERERLPGLGGPHRHARRRRQPQEFPDRPRVAPEERRGHDDLPHGKPIEQFGHGVEVIGVGMGDDERVDPRQALVPEHGRHGPPGRRRRSQPAGVVDEASPRRTPHHDPTAMPHRRHHHPHLGRLRSEQPRGAGADPAHDDPCRGHRGPCAQADEPLPRQADERKPEQHIPSRQPPARRPGHPAVAPRQPGGPRHDGPDAAERAVAGPAAGSRQRGRHGRRHQAQAAPRHRHRHQRRDQWVEHQPHRTDQVKPRRDQRRRHRPHGGPRHHHLQDVAGDPAQPPFEGCPTPLDEPLDGVVDVGAGQGGRRADQHGGREERQLGADAEQFGRMPEQHQDRRQRQRIDRQRPSAKRRPQAGQPDEQRRPEHGRLRPHEQHVEAGAGGHRHERPAAGQGDQPKHLEERQRQEPHMKPGDRQDMDRAGDEEFHRLLPRQRLAAAEQQGRRQGRPLGREMAAEHLHAAAPQPVDPSRERPDTGAGKHPHALRRMGPHDRQAPQRPGTLPKIELPGVQRRRRPHATPEHPHPTARRQIGRLPIHDQGRAARRGPPRGPPPNGPHRQHALARGPLGRRTGRRAPQRIDHRHRQPPGRLHHDPLDRDGLGRLGEAPGQIVAGKQVPPGAAPARAAARDPHQHCTGRHGMSARAESDRPAADRDQGEEPPYGRRQVDSPADRTAGDDRRSHDHQRPFWQRLTPHPASPAGGTGIEYVGCRLANRCE